jgi:hypothetical protein
MSEYYEPLVANVVAQAEENKLVRTALTNLPEPYISGLKLNADVVINNLILNTIDNNDVVWVVSDIEGWWTLPDNELPDLPRGWGDGSYDAVGRFANRIITLNGSFLPQRPGDAPAARDALIRAVNLIKTGGWLVVYEDKLTDPSANGKAAYVRLSGTPQITSTNARGRHDFSIGLKAVDPIKYEYVDGNPDGYQSATITLGGSANVTNSGNVPVPAIFVLTGGVQASSNVIWTITNTPPDVGDDAESINLVGAVANTDVLEIDTYNREILLVTPGSPDVVVNGRNKAEILVDWIYLKPGVNTVTFARTGGTGSSSHSCQILWRSGWIG